MRKTILFLCMLLLCSVAGAQQFAIFVDKATGEACRSELDFFCYNYYSKR